MPVFEGHFRVCNPRRVYVGAPFLGASCSGPVVLSVMTQVGVEGEEWRPPNPRPGDSDSVVPGRSEEPTFWIMCKWTDQVSEDLVKSPERSHQKGHPAPSYPLGVRKEPEPVSMREAHTRQVC